MKLFIFYLLAMESRQAGPAESAVLPSKMTHHDLSCDLCHLVASPRQKFQSPVAAVRRFDEIKYDYADMNKMSETSLTSGGLTGFLGAIN